MTTRLNATTWLTDSGVTITWDGTTLTIAGATVPPAFRKAALRAALGIVDGEPPDDAAQLAAHGAEIWTGQRRGM